MGTVRRTVGLGAGPPEVWDFVTDPDNFARYVSGYDSGEVTSERATNVGAVYEWLARLGPLRLRATERIVHWDPPREVRYEGRLGGVAFRSSMVIDEERGDRSHLTAAIETTPGGPRTIGRLLDGIVAYELGRSLGRVADQFPVEGERLESVKSIYSVWGRHPALYALQDPVTFLGRHRLIRRKAVRGMGVGDGARVLELACGTGRNFPYVEEAIGTSGELVAFDYSAEMLAAAGAYARHSGWDNIRFVQGDAAVLDVGDEPFDGAVCVLGMSAIPDHVRAIERCHEVLRRGGVLAVCDARPFGGRLKVLNPLVRAVYASLAGWNPDLDIPGDLSRVFQEVTVDKYNFGTFFVAAARKGR